ncbi:SDR family oxidoreductase [Bacterioplanoides pacificum]|uniref:SDR family oxidoreductase n=1 Tax=Bacterioplanoides pacificum TaxID=1171596 RepID=A0ABV7VVC2_9GAMM
MNKLKRIVIFAATSAIAEQCARIFVQHQASVFCIARDEGKLSVIVRDLTCRAQTKTQIITGTTADLADTSQHAQLFDRAMAELGGIDTVLIAHGTLPDQQACEASADLAIASMHLNAISTISLMTHAANRLEPQGNGVIAVISSVAGDRGRKSNYVYGSAKGMVSLFAEGLRNRLFSSGVNVITVKPGFVDTPMTASFDKSGPLWAQPDQIAAGIVKAMQQGRNTVYLPGYWWAIMQAIRHIPEVIFKRLSL